MNNSRIRKFSALAVFVTGLACLLALAVGSEASVQAFSNASLSGSYGFLSTKWTADSTQSADNALGILTFDGVSAVTYSLTDNSAGSVTTVTGSGTYSVKSNGTGTITVTSTKGNVTVLTIAINSAGKGFQFVITNCNGTCGNEVNTGTAVAMLGTSFSNASLKGVFGFLSNTWTPTSTVDAQASIGVVSFDGVSKVTAAFTSDSAGILKTISESGTYAINADGSGTLTLPTSTIAVVINTAGKQIQFLQTSCGGTCSNEVQSGTAIHQ